MALFSRLSSLSRKICILFSFFYATVHFIRKECILYTVAVPRFNSHYITAAILASSQRSCNMKHYDSDKKLEGKAEEHRYFNDFHFRAQCMTLAFTVTGEIWTNNSSLLITFK